MLPFGSKSIITCFVLNLIGLPGILCQLELLALEAGFLYHLMNTSLPPNVTRLIPPQEKIPDSPRLNYEQYEDFLKNGGHDDGTIRLMPVIRWDYKPEIIQVNRPALIELFGKKLEGLTLHLDKRTQRYEIPRSADITEDERLELAWFNPRTYENFCVNRIGHVKFLKNVQVFGRVVCMNDFDQDRCCGTEDTCQCVKGTFGCACINDEDHARKVKMWQEEGSIVSDVVDWGEKALEKLKTIF